MKEHYDPWNVRLPDGRTIKAKSTTSVRHHIEAGNIPLNSMVRRDSGEEWANLVWVAEFADLGTRAGATPPTLSGTGTSQPPRSGVAGRLDPMRLLTVGIRGLIDELIAALDSTLTRSKMAPAFVASVLIYLGFFGARAMHHFAFNANEFAWVPTAAGAAFALLVLCLLNTVLAKLTHIELSTMRPARLGEAIASLPRDAVPVLIANVLFAGGSLGLLFLMTHLQVWSDDWLHRAGLGDTAREVVFTPILVLIFLFSVLIWIVVGLCWLLTPAIVVEETSWLGGIREWRQLLRDHFGRIVVYEGLTILLGVAIALPLTLAVSLSLHGTPTLYPAWPLDGSDSNWVEGGVKAAVQGLTAAPVLALLAVANVFIYLNLRYEQGK
jgi:hypothetical protein